MRWTAIGMMDVVLSAERALMKAITGTCPCSNLHKAEKDWRFSRAGHTVMVMVTILCALVSIFEFRVRSRASLELEAGRPDGLEPRDKGRLGRLSNPTGRNASEA